jgi:hypothetical protein
MCKSHNCNHKSSTTSTASLTPAQARLIYDTPLLKGDPSEDYAHYTQMLRVFSKSRSWFSDLTHRYTMHPAVFDVITNNQYAPYIKDWREMMLEWPHESVEEPSKIAYTQDDDKGMRDIQTRTSVGKYLRRHMPTLPDHLLRDLVAEYIVDPKTCQITTDMEQMLWVLDNGPHSCMQKSWSAARHPYRVYDPSLGWGMAYRMQGDDVVARALVQVEDKVFVRAYSRGGNDNLLEAWLKGEGYVHDNDWEGYKVKVIEGGGCYVMPYIDGNAQSVDRYCTDTFVITESGEYDATNTDGTLCDSGESCSDCGDRYHEDELTYVDEDGNSRVCDRCLSRNYTYVYGRRGDQYYLHDHSSDVVYCESDGENYDGEYLNHHDIVYVDSESAYYKLDDVWCCEGSGEYYLHGVTAYEVDGAPYHEDHLPDGWEVDAEGNLVQVEQEQTTTTV